MVEPHFAPLGAAEPSPVLIFLEDTGALAAKVQQSKLAALGRLSASIAHEIRNPVGAMSHAAQLLSEASRNCDAAELRMTEIIRMQQCRSASAPSSRPSSRLSRRARRGQKMLHPRGRLVPALSRPSSAQTTQCAPASFRCCGTKPRIWRSLMDPSHLHQIIWNLCENALRHGRRRTRRPMPVELRGPDLMLLKRAGGCASRWPTGVPGFSAARRRERSSSRLLYPAIADGTGLGLFLARELAEINGATLLYEPRKGGENLFRLVFADPARWASAILPAARDH